MVPKKKNTYRDINQGSFFLFKTVEGDYALFDGDMEYPIRHGQLNSILSILQYFKNKLGRNFILYQFDISSREGFKKTSSNLNINPLNIPFPAIGFPTFPNKKNIPTKNKDLIYYHFKISPSTHILFDSKMDSSIKMGSKNEVSAQYRLMPKSASVYYFEKNSSTGFKNKISIKPNMETKTEKEKKETQSAEEGK